MGAVRRFLLTAVAAVVVVLAVPAPASAHGTLAMSNPKNNATVTAPMGSVELYFTEQVPDNAYFTITSPAGARVDNGWEHGSARPLDTPVTEYFMENGKFEPRQYTTGFPARVAVAHFPATGEYKIDYLSRASDGDSVHGTVTFKYTGPTTPAPSGWTPPTNQADPALSGKAVPPAAAPSSTAPAPAAAPPAAAPKAEENNLPAWLGGAAAVAVAVAGVALWRRRNAIPVVPIAVGGVVVALIGGYALGRTTARAQTPAAPAPPAAAPQAVMPGGHQHGGTAGGEASVEALGTTVSSTGYVLQPVRRTQAAGSTIDYAFRIVGADRQPATRFSVVHDKALHLVVVGRGLDGFQHLHPTMSADGVWSVPLKLTKPGTYRVFADFTVETVQGTSIPLVLGIDHLVPGAATEVALPPPALKAQAGPFTATMEGTPQAGMTAPVLFRVARSGAPGPATLERYLGAFGHLVVLREGDLGYVHVHPEAELVDGAIKFAVSIPGNARYRAYLEFQIAGQVHRAEYTFDLT
ncbi:copper resistance CopC family protein [Actinoplanes solisilvae]|uniref:copper resistance CopC family protein n=1 Tax=Actinoplanes solisilvae TaxID=2486853 RepID=UPI000FDBB09F|nr:copper resistance protein CopC [Actinoplanes solisilvae]